MPKQFVVRLRCYDIKPTKSGEMNYQISVSEQIDKQWIEKGRTEIVQNSENPQFSKAIELTFDFEQPFQVKFEVLNIQGYQSAQHKQTSPNCLLRRIKSYIRIFKMLKKILQAELQSLERYKYIKMIWSNCKFVFYQYMQAAIQLIKSKFMCFVNSAKHPFIKIYRTVQDSEEVTLVYTSESISFPTERLWPTIKQHAKELCNHDYNTALQIEFLDRLPNNQQEHIGQVKLSVDQMQGNQSVRNITNISTGANWSQINIQDCQVHQLPIFEQYIAGGLQLCLMISIDFTDSNGEVSNPESLHYFDEKGQTLSQYERALKNISEILIQYDHDKSIPLYGFGFVIQDSLPQHCYPMNNNFEDPEVQGLVGIFETYRQFVKTIKFSGPTNFRPTLQTAYKQAKTFQNEGSEKYVVLTILTDGLINDYDGSFEMIVDCSELPISIIIIGIGDADFTLMEKLNNDNLSEQDSRGRKASRDLVKFVAFNKFEKDSKRLAREVLSELPGQVETYMEQAGIKPKGGIPSQLPSLSNMRQSVVQDQLKDLEKYYKPNNYQKMSTLDQFFGDQEELVQHTSDINIQLVK